MKLATAVPFLEMKKMILLRGALEQFIKAFPVKMCIQRLKKKCRFT